MSRVQQARADASRVLAELDDHVRIVLPHGDVTGGPLTYSALDRFGGLRTVAKRTTQKTIATGEVEGNIAPIHVVVFGCQEVF